jgi:hypothetical protein
VTIHLLHGIHTGGPSWIEGFIPYLAPLDVKYPDYGWILGAETRVINPAVVGSLKPYIASSDVLLCHSNGCAIAYDLMHSDVQFAGAVFINAALEQDIVRPPGIEWIDVYFNSGDDITEAAKLGAALGIDDPVWGEMGHAGYVGVDPKISNINCGTLAGLPPLDGHSDIGTPAKFAKWGPYVANRIKTNLGNIAS